MGFDGNLNLLMVGSDFFISKYGEMETWHIRCSWVVKFINLLKMEEVITLICFYF